jgi:hypothetical protein
MVAGRIPVGGLVGYLRHRRRKLTVMFCKTSEARSFSRNDLASSAVANSTLTNTSWGYQRCEGACVPWRLACD